MTAATEAAGRPVVRPVSRSRVFWRSPLGRSLKRVPFYLLVLVVFVYTLFPFAWALRCAFTPEGDLFSSPLQYIPANPTLDNFKQAFETEFDNAGENDALPARGNGDEAAAGSAAEAATDDAAPGAGIPG